MRPLLGGDWRLRIASLLLAGICLFGATPTARADIWDWIVKTVSAENEQVLPVALSTTGLPEGAIATGPDEQRVLQFGKDIIEIYPDTVVAVELVDGSVRTVQIFQGTLKAHVAKRKKTEPFAVESTYLVALVKGTVFEFSTSAKGSAVSVYEGVVAVKSRGRVGGRDVSAGKTATVQNRDGFPSLSNTPKGGAPAATGAAPAAKATAEHPTTAPKPNGRSLPLPGAKPAEASKTTPGKPQKPEGVEPSKKEEKNRKKDKDKDKKNKGPAPL